MNAALELVRRHPFATFVVLAYAVSWCLLPVGTFLPFGPLVAALVVVAVTGGWAGLRALGARVLRWRVHWSWYAFALGVPVLVQLGVVVGAQWLGAPAPAYGLAVWTSVLGLVAVRLVNPVDGPLGEEPGWRGYAQPQLQAHRSPLAATAVLAVVITGWHVPLVLLPQFGLRPVDLVVTVAVTFWYGWLFLRTGSVLITLLAHAVEGSVVRSLVWGEGAGDALSWAGVVLWGGLALLVVLGDRRSWRPVPVLLGRE